MKDAESQFSGPVLGRVWLSVVLVVSVLVLVAAPGAGASQGVAGSLGGYGSSAGKLHTPEGLSVNTTGAGGVPSGTVYVADAENDRISQFSPTGVFVRAWGNDVVASGGGQAYEKQRITVNATGGSFTLTTVSATGSLHLTSGSNVVSEYTPQANEFTTNHAVVHVGDSITTSEGLPPDTTVTAVENGTLELSAAATKDADVSFTTREATGDISATAPTSSVASAIDALPEIASGGGSVSVSGGPGSAGGTTPYLVLFDGGPLAAKGETLLQAAPGSTPLTGGAATVSSGTINAGRVGFEVCDPGPPANDVCKAGTYPGFTAVAVNQATGDVYATGYGLVSEFSPTGSPIRTWGQNVVASGPNDAPPRSAVQTLSVTATAGKYTLSFGGNSTAEIEVGPGQAAAIQSGLQALASIGPGNTTVTEAASGVYTVTFDGALANNPEPLIEVESGPGDALAGGTATIVNTEDGATGFEICGQLDSCETSGADGTTAGALGATLNSLAVAPPGAPNAGDVVVADPANQRVQEFTSSGQFVRAFGFNVVSAGPDDTIAGAFEECLLGDACGQGTAGEGTGQFGSNTPNSVAADATGAIYTVERDSNFRVQKFSPQAGRPALAPSAFGVDGAPDGSSATDTPTDISVGVGGHIFVAKAFAAEATLTCPDGQPSGAERRIQELTADGLTLTDTHMACNALTATSGLFADPTDGTLYVSVPEISPFSLGHRVYLIGPSAPPSLTLDAITEESPTGAKVSGTLNPNASTAFPNSPTVSYHLEYKLSSSPNWTQYATDVNAGTGAAAKPIAVYLSGLIPNREYDVRLVARKDFHEGIVVTAPQTFITEPAPPAVDFLYASNVTATSADLSAVINPYGEDTEYQFEYGPTSEYESASPALSGEIPASPSPQERTVHLSGLNGGTYHFRLVAKSNAGKTTTGDQTFTFNPPSCPNSHLRQQTGSAFLPDCRAYELVSPAKAGNVSLGVEAPLAERSSGPSRFAFSGSFGTIAGSGEPRGYTSDLYVATRTPVGWTTRYIGLPGSQAADTGGPPLAGNILNGGANLGNILADEGLNKFIDWKRGSEGSYAGYLWDSSGEALGRVPTNLAEIVGAENALSEGGFVGDVKASADFSHYFFSSGNLPFSSGGLDSAPGSAYDDNLRTGEVTVISKTALGSNIPQDTGGPNEYIKFPAVSNNGSHVLMSTEAPEGATHLYMSVNDAPSYDVTLGQDGINHSGKFVGMTEDGTTVYFTSTEQLTADDHDSSADLFMWKELPTPSLTRVSQGPGTGDGDGCVASWTAGCGVAKVEPITQINQFAPELHSDNSVAAQSGDVYFYSPEQLELGQGTPGQRNLYVYRNEQVQYVATFPDGTRVTRMQVTPDGKYAAFLSTARLTSYDNTSSSGVCSKADLSTGTGTTGPSCLEMYSYDAASRQLRCVSCMPNGMPPTSDAAASQNGLFMSDDGRIAFATGDPLVPQDTNGLIDVYEYVDNRPQLISSGTSSVDELGGNLAGLVGISADGTDLYFLTTETFVGQDLNGPFMKFYDARTGGGFAFAPAAAPCAAADECHGPSSVPPESITPGTSSALGTGGNAGRVRHKRHMARTKHRHHGKPKHRGRKRAVHGKRSGE